MTNTNAGFTITPMVGYNEDGSEFIRYDDAHVVDNSTRQEVIAFSNNHQEDWLHEDAEGNIYHDFDVEDSYQYSDDYEEPFEPEDITLYDTLTDDNIAELQGSVGMDDAQYQEMVSWAADTLPDEFIETFDDIIETGDWQEIEGAIQYLNDLYENGYSPEEYSEELTQEEYESNLETAYNLMEEAGYLQGENDLASTALFYMAGVVKGDLEFESAIGYVADEYGAEYTHMIFSQILDAYNLD